MERSRHSIESARTSPLVNEEVDQGSKGQQSEDEKEDPAAPTAFRADGRVGERSVLPERLLRVCGIGLYANSDSVVACRRLTRVESLGNLERRVPAHVQALGAQYLDGFPISLRGDGFRQVGKVLFYEIEKVFGEVINLLAGCRIHGRRARVFGVHLEATPRSVVNVQLKLKPLVLQRNREAGKRLSQGSDRLCLNLLLQFLPRGGFQGRDGRIGGGPGEI